MAKSVKVFLLIILGVGVLVAISVKQADVAPPPETPAQKAADAEAQKENAVHEAFWRATVYAARGLRSEMRDPDSFKLARVLMMPDGASCYEYRARNGFGGMNLGQAVLTKDGDLLISEQEGFSRAWDRECADKIGEDKTWEVGYAAGFHGFFGGDN